MDLAEFNPFALKAVQRVYKTVAMIRMVSRFQRDGVSVRLLPAPGKNRET
jgi:hypothetical protein